MERPDKAKEEQVEYYQNLSFEKEYVGAGGLTEFNIHYGYLEGVLRGFRSGFLTETNYRTLCQVSKLEEFKVAMVDTDYNGVLDDAAGDTKITSSYIASRCYSKFVEEFMHIRTQATGSLKTFLDLIRYEYMIDNIIVLLRGMANKNDPNTLLKKLNPLGVFPNIKSVLTFDSQDEKGLLRLFETVLIDTPVGHLFERYFVDNESGGDDGKDVVGSLSASKIDIVANMVKKLWLHEFYAYCLNLGGETTDQMKLLLEFEADRRAISIMVNSFGTVLNEAFERDTRQKLFCSFGTLYNEGTNEFRKTSDMEKLSAVLMKYPLFNKVFEDSSRGDKDVEDCLFEAEVKLNEFSFWGQNHFASFWGFVRLKEQEQRNLYWIAECITANIREPSKINKWIPILAKQVE